jgi:hypothetical protein
MNPISKHPNAITALISGATIGSGVTWLVQHWLGWKLSPQSGLYIGTGVASAVLFIGRNGWDGIKGLVLHGTGR